jgi:signal transduction histidine kinase/ligand-binding sensor domain-containing protein/DNA-binding response OmpR family regulator
MQIIEITCFSIQFDSLLLLFNNLTGMKSIISTLIAVLISITSGAQTYKVSYLTADEGLSRNFVNYIYKDSKGFMWFATSKGLDRYDGYDFLHFNNSQLERYLPADVVNCIVEDQRGDYWLGTENGLYFFSYSNSTIIPATEKLGVKHSFLNSNISILQIDSDGGIWIGHEQGISIITLTKNECSIRSIYTTTSLSSLLLFNGYVYVAEGNSVFRLVKDNLHQYSKVQAEQRLLNLPSDVNTLFYDNSFIWIGTGFGLYRYDPVSEELRLYQNQPGVFNSLSSDVITEIRRTKDGPLLIGTLIGLNIFDYQTNTFRRITSDAVGNNEVLNNNFISALYVDENMIWVGTEKGGVNVLRPEQSFFTHYVHVPSDKGSISKNPVNAVFEDSEGDLLVGTVEGGLNIRKKGSKNFIHILAGNQSTTGLSHNSVSAIIQDFNQDYWIATWGRGLNFWARQNKYRPVFTQFMDMEGSENGISSNFVSALVSDSSTKGIWIGTRSGVDFLSLPERKFFKLFDGNKIKDELKFVTGMLIDRQSRLWIGTSNGLFVIHLKKTDFRKGTIAYDYYKYELSNPESTKIEKINSILQTRDGNVWFGSNGHGIYKLELNSSSFQFIKIDESEGLIDNVVYGLLEDEAGNIWMSTDKGLCAFNPTHGTFRHFTTADGLISNQFYWDAYHKGADGKMYFGHVAGLTVFEPLKYSSQQTTNRVTITRITVLNEHIFPANATQRDNLLKFDDSNQLKRIRLHESDKTFSIEFSALSYHLPHKIKYAYRLRGFENEWQEVKADRRFASFTNIGWGIYTLELRCTNADGTWSDQLTTLQIKIVPPFYKSVWFVLLLTLLIGYGTYLLLTYRIRRLKNQELHLKQMVEERTQQIEEQKKKLEEQARRVQEATVDKISFFTNITHEFRTPITLIMGPVERSLKLSTNPKVLEQLHIVRRNSKLLLSLVNQLMDFRKIESDKMELSKAYHDIVEFLEDLILPFEDLGKDRGIIFHKQFRILTPELFIDKDSLQKVVTNLLSNALKFTPDNGVISVVASVYTDKSDQLEKLYVAVKNTGSSIPEDELERIFDRFYQSNSTKKQSGYGQSGTGIGLFLCKRLIELNKGKIEAMNLHSGGVTFRFIIPVERQGTGADEVVKPQEKFMEEHVLEAELHEEEAGSIPKNKPTLLIVEDNPDMRQFIRLLMKDDFNILEASNGITGLEVTNRYQPDIILSDIMMPDMDGIEFCKNIKTSFTTSHIPVIMLTAKSATETQIDSMNSGADAYLTKPFDEELLKAVLKNLNDKKNKTQVSFAEKMDTSVLNISNESQDKKFLDKALEVLKNNYTNPEFDVTEFIDAMAISRSLLHKKLTNLAGQSASRFIRTYRLNMAKEILKKNRESHSMNISEVAYQVGFNDPKYFTRCFTRHFGIQPSAFMDER